MSTHFRHWPWLILALLATAPSAHAHRTYLAREASGAVPESTARTEFSCDDTIYAVAEFQNLSRGGHELQAHWSDPQGRVRERTPLQFRARLASERVWVWLRLTRPAGSSAIAFLDPSAGMSEFIGRWTVALSLDGAKLDTLEFKVLC